MPPLRRHIAFITPISLRQRFHFGVIFFRHC
jgi:hypothetical protein